MQIEVVDDCSTLDDPGAVVREFGAGRVQFHRRAMNGGNVANFNTCISRAAGRIVHILHGDDWVLPGFYPHMEQALRHHPTAGAAFCRYFAHVEKSGVDLLSTPELETRGVIPDWLRRISEGQRLQPPAMVVRRDSYEQLGGFDARLSGYAEDWEMWVRIAAAYPVVYEPEPLAVYRVSTASISAGQLRSGANMQKLRLAVELNRAHFSPALGERIARTALEASALAALRRANRIHGVGDRAGALAQVNEALRTRVTLRVLLKGLDVAVRGVGRELIRLLR